MYKRFLARRVVPVSLATALLSLGSPVSSNQSSNTARVQAIRFWSFGDVTRVAIQTDGEYKLQSDQIENPPRVYFDLTGLRPPAAAHRGMETIQVGDHRVKQIRVAEVSPGRTRIVFDLEGPADIVSSQLVNPDRLMIEVRPKGVQPSGISIAHSTMGSRRVDLSDPPAPKTDPAPVQPIETKSTAALVQTLPPPHTAAATAAAASKSVPRTREVEIASPAKSESDGDRSLVRVFGLKLGKVVIDAGHGGHDTGTIGRNGLMEKDLVLDVALRLGKLITQKLGAEVVYTRSSDVFIPLEERTKIADAEKADLFISIHANSSPDAAATGVETYYFNLTSDKSGLDLATRENATSTSSISDLNDLLHKAVLQNKLEESREFAQKVQTALWTSSVRMNRQSRDRGVRQAPFVVLIGATMPSILAEIGFVSNPHDERLMKRNDQRQKIAEALFRGISQYANTLSHVQMARTRTE
jgi:N-acetylmuramoyl-L-alanine amidase